MSSLSLLHIVLGLAALLIGILILSMRKGGPRHRLLGWVYFACMATSLATILVAGRARLVPFHGYAGVLLGALVIAVAVPRLRGRMGSFRSWHGALMSLSLLGAVIALGGVVGGGG